MDFEQENKEIIDYALRNMVNRFGKDIHRYFDDLKQEGYIGILHAERNYVPGLKVPLEKFKLVCAIRAMARLCVQEKRQQMRESSVDFLPEILICGETEIQKAIFFLINELTEDEKRVLDRLLEGDYLYDIALKLQVRKETVVELAGNIKTKLRGLKYD